MSSAVPSAITDNTPWGPAGLTVYNRTYSRTKPDGNKETWPETVCRVAKGNLALVYGDDDTEWSSGVLAEYGKLVGYMLNFALLPAGRHLWATGVELKGRNFLSNCHVAGWGDRLSRHFEFSFLRLMEGGGVGSNYSMKYIGKYGAPKNKVNCHITTIRGPHADHDELIPYLSAYDSSRSTFFIDDSREGWAEALTDLIDSAYAGSVNRSYDVSGVRPSGSPLKTFGGTASGPAPFARMMLAVADILNASFDHGTFTPLDAMEIDHAIAECVVSGGNRRSARMSIVAWDDPYIREFLACKEDTGKHWTTNISVEIDDNFLKGLSRGFERHNCAKEIHVSVVAGMLENGEPGYWNKSLNSKGEVDDIIASNPCSEIALEPWGVCTLGHVNMDYFAHKSQDELVEAHRLMTRFLMRATFSDYNDDEQKKVVERSRRIGVGHLGVQGYWAKQGVRYSDIPLHAPRRLDYLYQAVRQEAREYAFQLRIPEPVKVTAIAPTGSVAKLPGVSEGIHPIYARHFERRIRFSKRDPQQFETVMQAMADGFTVEDDVYDESGMTAVVVYPTEDILLSQVRALGFQDDVVQSTEELSIRDMLAVQYCYQANFADNAISYTVNIPAGKYWVTELANIMAEFLPVLKGTTVMVDASRPQAPYTRITQAEYEAAVATKVEDSIDESCSRGSCPVR